MLSLERAMQMNSPSCDPSGNSPHTASKGDSTEAPRFLQDLLWEYLFEFLLSRGCRGPWEEGQALLPPAVGGGAPREQPRRRAWICLLQECAECLE